jgi:transaldolase
MKIFLDTAQVDEIREAAFSGVIDGVTTNPSLIKRSGRDFKEVVNEIAEILPEGAISAEVLSEDSVGMLKEAREYAAWRNNIVIKIPMTAEGSRRSKCFQRKVSRPMSR